MSLNKKSSETKVIKSTIILEIIGKPPEHLVSTLEDIIKRMNEEKGVQVTGKRINEPLLMKDSKEYYTTFAEVDIEVEDILYLAIVMFKYMPAHVEVISPELIALTNNGWTDILSELARRLHGYDEIARMMRIEHAKMQRKMNEILSKENKEPQEIIPSSEESEIKEENKKKISKKKKDKK